MVAEATEIKRLRELNNKILLNSKTEYNRTIIPDIEEKPISQEELERELWLDEKIDNIRKEAKNGTKRKKERTHTDNTKRIRFQLNGNTPDLNNKTQSRESQLSKEEEGRLGAHQARCVPVKNSHRPEFGSGWVTSEEGPGDSNQTNTPKEHSMLGLEGLPSNLDPIGVRIVPITNFSAKKTKKTKKSKNQKKIIKYKTFTKKIKKIETIQKN